MTISLIFCLLPLFAEELQLSTCQSTPTTIYESTTALRSITTFPPSRQHQEASPRATAASTVTPNRFANSSSAQQEETKKNFNRQTFANFGRALLGNRWAHNAQILHGSMSGLRVTAHQISGKSSINSAFRKNSSRGSQSRLPFCANFRQTTVAVPISFRRLSIEQYSSEVVQTWWTSSSGLVLNGSRVK